MYKFTSEETNLICIYNTGSRESLLLKLTLMKTHLEKDETELMELTQSVIDKITTMNDGEFESITVELIADF